MKQKGLSILTILKGLSILTILMAIWVVYLLVKGEDDSKLKAKIKTFKKENDSLTNINKDNTYIIDSLESKNAEIQEQKQSLNRALYNLKIRRNEENNNIRNLGESELDSILSNYRDSEEPED